MRDGPEAPPRYVAMDTSLSVPVRRIAVDFAGPNAGTGPLSWGQRAMWTILGEQQSWLPMGGWPRVRPGRTVADLAEQLRYLMSRFTSLRTRLHIEPDGKVSQEVYADGRIMFDVVDAGEHDLEYIAEATFRRIADPPLDFTTQWPIRMGVICRGEQVTHMAIAISHFVADANGLTTLLTEVIGRADNPVTGLDALAQARWQHSPAGRRQDDAAARYWQALLRSMPVARPPHLGACRDPRFWLGVLRSPAMRVAVARLSARTNANPADVLLASYAFAVGKVTGLDRIVVVPFVSNRFRPGLANVVGVTMQRGLCVIDVDGIDVDGLVARARQASIPAYKYAYYDPSRMDELIATVCGQRGPDYALTFHFNDRRRRRAMTVPDHADDTARGGQSATSSTFAWIEGRDKPYEPFMVHVDDDGAALSLQVTMDTAVIGPVAAEEIVWQMEAAVLAAAGW